MREVMALVPLRSGKRLRGQGNAPKSIIQLWDSRDTKRGDDATSEVVFGRQKLLQCLYAACGCHRDINSTKGSCTECQAVNQWATRALSHRMIRFVSNCLQVRGEHAVVTVKLHGGRTIVVKGPKNDTDEWKGNIKVNEGTRISFMPRIHNESYEALDFEVVSVDPTTNKIIEGSSTSSSKLTEDAKAARVPEKSANTKTPSCLKASQKPNETLEMGTRLRSNRTLKVPSATNRQLAKPSVSQTRHVATRSRTGTRNTLESSGKETENKVRMQKSSLSISHNQDTKQSRQIVIMNDDKKTKTYTMFPEDGDRNSTFVLYFCPLGQDLPHRRITILSKKAKKMGASVVSDFRCATHIIISDQVSSMKAVADALGVAETNLNEHLDRNKVPLIDPKWLVSAKVNELCAPTAKDWWPGRLPPAQMNSKKRAALDTTHPSKKSRRPSAVSSENPCAPRNAALSEQFRILSKLHQKAPLLEQDPWKAYTFNLISGRLRFLDFEIEDEEDVEKLKTVKGFGEGVLDKVMQYLKTGEITRIKEFEKDPDRIAMRNMMRIWGVGRIEASRLVQHHRFQTIDHVRKAIKRGKLQLERNQLVGVECYEDINDEMTRHEVEQIGAIVKETTIELYPGAEVEIMGSYRRGKKLCGDVDVHITHKDFERRVPDNALGKILDQLWNKGGIVAFHLTYLHSMETGKRPGDFAAASRFIPDAAWEATRIPTSMQEKSRHGHSSSSYMGVFHSPVVNGKRRRVDIKLYPYRERAFASLYFTGNGYFNRSMRLRARHFSYSLNDHGLFQADSRVRVMEATTEGEVFAKLGLQYKNPQERDCFDAAVPLGASSHYEAQMDDTDYYKEESQHVWIN